MLSLILLSISILSGFAFQNNAFAAQSTGMEVSLTAAEGSTTISLSGTTSITNKAISVIVTGPLFGNLITIDQLTPNADGSFMTDIKVGGEVWKHDGTYTVAISQGKGPLYNFALSVEVTGGTTQETSVSASTLKSLDTGIVRTEKRGLTMTADAVVGTTIISISGQTDRITDITIVITSPIGNIISVDQITPNADGSFMIDINIGGEQWKQNGDYTIKASQGTGLHQDVFTVDVMDGVIIPEFGTIALMILAVAIISIIAVSAKTRLSVIPRY